MFFSSAYLSMFYIWRYKTKLPKLKFCVKTWMGSILLSGLRDQNNGKKIGISGPRTYHVTTLVKSTESSESRAAILHFLLGLER